MKVYVGGASICGNCEAGIRKMLRMSYFFCIGESSPSEECKNREKAESDYHLWILTAEDRDRDRDYIVEALTKCPEKTLFCFYPRIGKDCEAGYRESINALWAEFKKTGNWLFPSVWDAVIWLNSMHRPVVNLNGGEK